MKKDISTIKDKIDRACKETRRNKAFDGLLQGNLPLPETVGELSSSFDLLKSMLKIRKCKDEGVISKKDIP